MEEAGWIRAEWIKKDTGRRARVYTLTCASPVALSSTLRSMESTLNPPPGLSASQPSSVTPTPRTRSFANSLRQLVAQRHNGLRVSNITTELDLVREPTMRERLLAMLAAFFAGVALLLAALASTLSSTTPSSSAAARSESAWRLARRAPASCGSSLSMFF